MCNGTLHVYARVCMRIGTRTPCVVHMCIGTLHASNLMIVKSNKSHSATGFKGEKGEDIYTSTSLSNQTLSLARVQNTENTHFIHQQKESTVGPT